MNEKWMRWMEIGRKLGCHQMPERSFFYRGYQFPVCARCTGVIVSSIVATISFFICKINILTAFILSSIMFIDWFIQYIGIIKSTNFRRVITGFLGGYGFMTLQLYGYKLVLSCVRNLFGRLFMVLPIVTIVKK